MKMDKIKYVRMKYSSMEDSEYRMNGIWFLDTQKLSFQLFITVSSLR